LCIVELRNLKYLFFFSGKKPWFTGSYQNGDIYRVKYVATDDTYLLKKPSGATCVMYARDDPSYLEIDSSCEDYSDSFKAASFDYQGMTWKDGVVYTTV